ncbi:transposase [Arthrobacter sp. PvP102]|nr:transposase [Arthrobacter sp. PvP103]MBP1237642.1 transposase [Arthrobacter sp. PvP102]
MQTSDEIPLRSRLTSRLVAGIIAGLSTELRAVSRVAAAAGVSWTTVMRVTADTAVLDGGADRRLIRRLVVDEHRFRRVRYLKDDAGKVTRDEPWSIVFTGLDTGAILDIVDGRRGQAARDWIRARPRWRNRVELVAMDMSTEFRRAVRKALPKAAITVDHWHGVAPANQMVTEVRRRRAHDLHGRRGRATDPAWMYRKLLTCTQENMSGAQRGRTQEIIASDIEPGVVWGIKEHVRQLLKTDHIDAFQRAWAEVEHAVKATRIREAKSLFLTLKMWRRELLTFCRTRATQRSGEPQREKPEAGGARIPEPRPLQAPVIVVHGSPTSLLNTCRHARSGRAIKAVALDPFRGYADAIRDELPEPPHRPGRFSCREARISHGRRSAPPGPAGHARAPRPQRRFALRDPPDPADWSRTPDRQARRPARC